MPATISHSAPIRKKVLGQLSLIFGASLCLGLSFNAYNPIGIRLSEPSKVAAIPEAHAESPILSASASTPSIAVTNPALHKQAGTSTNASLPTITWKEAKPLVSAGQAVLVDARGRPTYEAGHIPGAISLPIDATAADFASFVAKYATNRLILYCSHLTCETSEHVGEKLVGEYSCKSVTVMKGGYAEWQKAELGYDPTPTGTTWEQVEPLTKSGQVVLVDARPKAAYEAGHIPGAISLPEAASTADDLAAFQKKYEPQRRIVVYCSDLKCSASMRLAIKLASWYNYQRVQYMPGGYQEWLRSQSAQAKSNAG